MTDTIQSAKYNVANPTPAARVINVIIGGARRQKLIAAGAVAEGVEIEDHEADSLRTALKKVGAGNEVSLEPVRSAPPPSQPAVAQQSKK